MKRVPSIYHINIIIIKKLLSIGLSKGKLKEREKNKMEKEELEISKRRIENLSSVIQKLAEDLRICGHCYLNLKENGGGHECDCGVCCDECLSHCICCGENLCVECSSSEECRTCRKGNCSKCSYYSSEEEKR